MKITPIHMRTVNPYQTTQRNVSASKANISFADKLEISTQAKEMQATSTYAKERSEKVQKLKAEIQSGEYQVNARQVAEDMLKYYRY